MILARITEHLRNQDWTAVAIEFVIVVIGVFVGLQVQEWHTQRGDEARLKQIVAALMVDIDDARRVEAAFVADVTEGLRAFETAYREGRQPPPFVFRITGSDTAPNRIWGTLQDAGLGLLIDPQLLFELNHFYSEREGIGVKVTRYMESVETLVLPWLGGDPAYFYVDGRMRPEILATMDRLREWASYLEALGPWSLCLQKRLERASEPGESCRVDFEEFAEPMPAAAPG